MIHHAILCLTLHKKLLRQSSHMFKEQLITNNSQKVINLKKLAWYQLEDYEVDDVKRQLLCRLATNKDVKNT